MEGWWAVGAIAAIIAAGEIRRGSLLRRVAPKPRKDKLESYDFRARTRPGLYRTKGGVFLRVDWVAWSRPRPGQSVHVSDWCVGVTTTVGGDWSGRDLPPVFDVMPLYKLQAFRRASPKEVPMKWVEWFAMHPPDHLELDERFNLV